MATPKKIVLITGATSGIGLELAAQLVAKPTYHVLIGARSPEKGAQVLQTLQSRNPDGSAEFLHLDVTDDSTISRAAEIVQSSHGKLDLLVNNAAIVMVEGSLRTMLRAEFDVNATGVAVVTETFAPLLQKSTGTARIVNVSSAAGSINRRLDPTSDVYSQRGVAYHATKTAMNMITACHWVEYGPQIKVFAFCPGYTVSNLHPVCTAENGASPVRDTALALVNILEGKRDDEAGRFLHKAGQYPW